MTRRNTRRNTRSLLEVESSKNVYYLLNYFFKTFLIYNPSVNSIPDRCLA